MAAVFSVVKLLKGVIRLVDKTQSSSSDLIRGGGAAFGEGVLELVLRSDGKDVLRGRLFRVLQIFSGLEVLPGGIEVRACRPNPTPHPDPDPAGVFVEAIDPGGEKNVENSGRLGTQHQHRP